MHDRLLPTFKTILAEVLALLDPFHVLLTRCGGRVALAEVTEFASGECTPTTPYRG
jgi:hypothetical protein